MSALTVVIDVAALGAAFVGGILVGRKNTSLVEKVVSVVKTDAAVVEADVKKVASKLKKQPPQK